jgi:chromosomal replication initiation ATPase DnaA
LLARLLAARQLAVGQALQDFLLARLPRRPGALREAVARLDRAALAAGGRISRTLAMSVIEGMEADAVG